MIQRPPSNSDHLPTATIILKTPEKRPPVNNGHTFGVPRVVVVHKFDYVKHFRGIFTLTGLHAL
jgi:hypothetical protein